MKKKTPPKKSPKPLGYIVIPHGEDGPRFELRDQHYGQSMGTLLCESIEDAHRFAFSEDIYKDDYDIVPVFIPKR